MDNALSNTLAADAVDSARLWLRLQTMARIGARRGHFMPAGLLDSQLAALEPPVMPAERCVTVDVGPEPRVIQAAVASALSSL